jgi:hypothetical protein
MKEKSLFITTILLHIYGIIFSIYNAIIFLHIVTNIKIDIPYQVFTNAFVYYSSLLVLPLLGILLMIFFKGKTNKILGILYFICGMFIIGRFIYSVLYK